MQSGCPAFGVCKNELLRIYSTGLVSEVVAGPALIGVCHALEKEGFTLDGRPSKKYPLILDD